MNRRRFLAASAASLAVTAAPPLFAEGRGRDTSSDLETLLEVTRTPGLAMRTRIGARGIVQVGGVREAGGTDRVIPDSPFPAASLTKPVFAMAVRGLVRAGRLEWRKPLQQYAQLGLTGVAASITAEHVLTHATGLPNWRFDPTVQLSSTFPPGTSWQYSGEGYVLLQRVVEAITGEPLGTYLNKTLLPSLGMVQSTFTWSPQVARSAVAGHDSRGRKLDKSAVFYDRAAFERAQKAGRTTEQMTYDEAMAAAETPLAIGVVPNAAGSLWTTIADYARFLDFTREDWAAHPEEYRAINKVNRNISWALSWGIDTSLGRTAWFHWGDGPGVRNFAWWEPSSGRSIVILTNGDHGAAAYSRLLRQFLRADPIAPDWI